MTPAFPFEFSVVAALFWTTASSWFWFELRYNLYWSPKGKRRLRGSAELISLAGFAVFAFTMACYQFGWGYLDPESARPVMATAGTLVFASGSALRYWVIRVMGRHFTKEITILEGHEVVREGPFRILRHPSYLGSYLIGVGLSLAMGSLLALGAAVVLLTLVYPPRIAAEEKVLVEEFGDEYRAYQSGTKRMFPFLY